MPFSEHIFGESCFSTPTLGYCLRDLKRDAHGDRHERRKPVHGEVHVCSAGIGLAEGFFRSSNSKTPIPASMAATKTKALL